MKNKKLLLSVGVSLLFLVAISLTYAWFQLNITTKSNKDISIKIGTLKLKYTDGSSISAENMKPGWTESKVVTIENIGTKDVNYKLTWKKLINEIINDELLLSINCESSNGSCTDMNFTGLPVVTSPDDITDTISIKSGEIQTINLTFEFKETGSSQNYNKRKNFLGIIDVQEAFESDIINEYKMLSRIIDSDNNPVSNIIVEIDSTNSVVSDSNGYISINKITPGTHSLVIKDASNNTLDTKTIRIRERKTSNVTDNENIYVDSSLTKFATTMKLDTTNKIAEITNLMVPSDKCFAVSGEKITSYYSYSNCPTELIIPSNIGSQTITTLGSNVFNDKKIKKVLLPNTISTIENNAFSKNELTSIEIPSSVTSIGNEAFRDNKLNYINVPSTVTNVGYGIFNNNNLIDSQAFIYKRNSDGSIDRTTIISYGGKNKTITIPETVTTIGDYAFSRCGLNELNLTNNVKTIGSYAFYQNNLKNLTIPNNVTSLGGYAFSSNSLTSVSISNQIKTISSNAFEDNRLTSVVIPSSVTSIESYGFAYNSLSTVTLPNSLKTIGDNAFKSNKLTSLTIPNGVTRIGSDSFKGNNLTSLTIPSSVTYIGVSAFNKNQLPDSEAFIYQRNSNGTENKKIIVSYGGNNKNITIPSGVTTLAQLSLSESGLTSVTLPDTLTTIEMYALWSNYLTSITIPDGVTSISYNAFEYNNLKSVTIPSSVTRIYSGAYSSNNFTSVTIKGKTSSSEFTTYSPNWGWASSVTCVKDNTSNVTNGCITWEN